MDIESALNSMLFFSTIKNGQFDYTTPFKSNLISFDTDKKTELSPPLFEYLCYKLVKKKLMEGKVNTETILITENFLISLNKKNIILNTSVILKKHIFIFLQSIRTLKWNLIAFLNLEQQLKTCFDQNSRKPIIAKIISSNANSEEDDYILNTTMDKLENTFNFRSPDDIQFEVDSINISDQPNISIFLLNFLDGLIEQNDDDMISYIQKLYIEGSNNINENCIKYFSSFNEVKEDFLNLYPKYQNELKEYIKNNPKLEVEKIMNGNDEILNIDNNNGYIIEENEAFINGMSKTSLKNEKNEDIDMIQIEKDDDIDVDNINSDEEEEALKIMEKESMEAKIQLKNQKRNLSQRLYQQKLRLKNIDMYREFGVIKEEDNESESESIDIFGKMKEEEKVKKMINDSRKLRINKDDKINKVNKKINGIESENNSALNTIMDTNENKEPTKEALNTENNGTNDNTVDTEKKSKSDKGLKLNVLKELEQAIEEFELEQEPSTKSIENKATNNNNIFEELKSKNNKGHNNSNNNNNNKGNNNENKNNTLIVNENKENITKEKNREKDKNNSDVNKPNRKNSHKRNSNSEKRDTFNTNIKSIISVIKPKDKENSKKINNSNSVTKKVKSEKENSSNSSKKKEQTNEIKLTKTNKSSNSNKSKEKDSNSTNYNSQIIYNTNSYQSFNSNSNSNKSNNETDKHSKEKDNKKSNNTRKTEPLDNLTKKIFNAKIIFNNVKKKSSKTKHKKSKNTRENNSQLPAISIMSLIDGTYKSSTDKLDEPPRSQRNSNKNKYPKSSERKSNKNKKILSPIESPMNVLPPQKIVERNGLSDLQIIDKDEKAISSFSPKFQMFNLHSAQSEKNNGDLNTNINIENILSDEFEYEKEKNEFSEEGSLFCDNRTKKTMIKRGDKKINPPGKTKNSNKIYNENYCSYNEEGASKACGCIGEQANQLCMIF